MGCASNDASKRARQRDRVGVGEEEPVTVDVCDCLPDRRVSINDEVSDLCSQGTVPKWRHHGAAPAVLAHWWVFGGSPEYACKWAVWRAKPFCGERSLNELFLEPGFDVS